MSETMRRDPCDDPTPPTPPKPPVEPCPEPPQTTCPEPRPCPEPPPLPCPPKPPDPCGDDTTERPEPEPTGDYPPGQGGTPPPSQTGYPKEPPKGEYPKEPPTQTGYPTEPPRQGDYPKEPPKQGDYPKEPPRQADYPKEPPKQGEYPKEPPRQPEYPKDPPTQGEYPKEPPGQPEYPKDPPTKPKPSPCGESGAVHTQQQLAQAEADLAVEKAKVEELERSKTKQAALEAKVQSLKDTIKAQKKGNDDYRDFFNATQLQARGAASHIATVRCQLTIDKACVAAVIAAGKKRVDDARAARDAEQAKVTRLDQAYTRAAFELAEYKKLFDFFKSGLKDQVKKVAGDLSALQALADPKKDHCETEFYLTEMEWHLRSLHCKPETSTECYAPDLRLGTFLECWSPECYCLATDRATAAYNDAVVAEKLAKADLETAKTKLKVAEDELKTLEKNRRDWVLAELKARGCCKPKDKPAAAV